MWSGEGKQGTQNTKRVIVKVQTCFGENHPESITVRTIKTCFNLSQYSPYVRKHLPQDTILWWVVKP